ncbi:hypothetical protein J1N35_032184 [Gossypium stocksii]|uniref:Uncharacterized protein n=1 Tax=Gossypium stocksii TaxID=47602 RepID=A0A9D3V3Z0_9ROSI|nr:hypothetical protein J1N35_032184 [Gossypium stocksii]
MEEWRTDDNKRKDAREAIEGNYWVQNAGFWCELVLGLVVMVVVEVRGPLMWFPYLYLGCSLVAHTYIHTLASQSITNTVQSVTC